MTKHPRRLSWSSVRALYMEERVKLGLKPTWEELTQQQRHSYRNLYEMHWGEMRHAPTVKEDTDE